jgi:hypothetical protein
MPAILYKNEASSLAMQLKNIYKIILLATTFAAASASYAKTNLTCPDPVEIQSTDFTSPSIWIAPPVKYAVPDQNGMGLGGTTPKELVGTERIKIKGKDGWACVYRSEGGIAPHDYENKIRNIVVNNKFLLKYLNKVNKAFDKSERFLKHYPQDMSLGFVGYQFSDDMQSHNKQ